MMSLDPLRTTEEIRNSYFRYLLTALPINDVNLAKQFQEQLEQENRFVKGPILEATPPFQPGKTINQLIDEKILSPRFRSLASKDFPLDRALYLHQEEAIRKMILHTRNIVVATGTGSGKTETFLIPILSHLFHEEEKGTLKSGVRALLLYPMNALANDQLKRLRKLLANCPQVTFGRYTGETEESKRKAEEYFQKNFPEATHIPNELLSREEMRDNPPHILLTNYAMLEYLLLRPEDHEFFDGAKASFWRFIVVDEAHTYDGAKGIEMAMLLRRLKDRIVQSEPGKIQCIATSATLGRGIKDFPQVVRFASQLFNESYEWKADDPSCQDVIAATRLPLEETKASWGIPSPNLYEEWQTKIDQSERDLLQQLKVSGLVHGIPNRVLDFAKISAENSANPVSSFLHEVLCGDANLRRLRHLLIEKPQFIHTIGKQIFSQLDESVAKRAMAALVDLAAKAKPKSDTLPLLPARYHVFVRALEGAFISLAPQQRIFLDRRQSNLVSSGQTYPVFELATCRRCGAIYLVGAERQEGDYRFLKQSTSISEDNLDKVNFYLLCSTAERSETPDDEDELVATGEDVTEDTEWYVLCGQCGAIQREGAPDKLCACQTPVIQKLKEAPLQDHQINTCVSCGVRAPNLVSRFLTGQDAPVSVLTTALYQQIPEKTLYSLTKNQLGNSTQDEWALPVSVSRSQKSEQVGKGRQLLLFSDSRQDAAFFACYLDRTYKQILRRRLILKVLEKHAVQALANRWRVKDLVEPLRSEADACGIFPDSYSQQEQTDEVWKWLLLELMAYDRRNSLEGLGCLGFALIKPRDWQAPSPLLKQPWNLNEEEVWTLYQVLLDSLRLKGAITFPDNVSPEDDIFVPRNREYYFRENGADSKKHIFSWSSPGKGKFNRRLDYLTKLLREIPDQETKLNKCREALGGIWRTLSLANGNSCWKSYFSESRVDGVVYRLRHDFWELRPRIIDENIQWYQCNRCGNLTLHNLRGICPSYRCEGTLRLCKPEEIFQDNHYRNLYLYLNPLPLKAEEHTAQLTSEAAARLQDKFLRKEVNILSCSTTFELGVDVGELEAVLMRNMPPSTANYVQRAGRAGRRTETTAFALTFAQRKSHDLAHFAEPERMVSGKISPPLFEIRNEKIVRRHIYAMALAAFWKENKSLFGKVESFFFSEQKPGPEALKEFLDTKPKFLQEALSRVIPESLQANLGVPDWTWVSGMFDENEGVLNKATEEIRSDVEALEFIRKELFDQKKPSDRISNLINTLKNRSVIDFLSSRNVLPKYGFPVDVVELQILHHGDEAKRLELNRDLRIALSEYAPGSEVVAGGRLWVGYGLKRLPNRAWPEYQYAICENCGRYQRVLAEKEDSLFECVACGSSLEGRREKGIFVIPEFGFVTGNEAPGWPGEARPQRTYTTRTFFSGEVSFKESYAELALGSAKLVAKAARDGRLAVINRTGFKICYHCGYAVPMDQKVIHPHKNPHGRDCHGHLQMTRDLGHEFLTDVLDIRFEGYSNPDKSFWLSLVYALLEGASEALHISRDDLDGCLYSYSTNLSQPALILFDNVPGGAGHVQRLTENSTILQDLLKATKSRINGQCGCGEDTSCYGCLRHYGNQFCHDELKRGIVLEFLENLRV